MVDELISIIVPVYNVESYIEKCINSLIVQTYSNIEIILVDDGSSDASAKICYDFSQKYKNVYLYEKENGGVSSARNLGIKKSSGSRIVFVDGDDYVAPQFIEELYKFSVQYKADLVRSLFDKAGKTNNYLIDFHGGKAIFVDLAFDNILNVVTYAWGIMINRSVLGCIEFDERIHYGEDRCFILQILIGMNKPKILVVNKSLYTYVVRNNAITQSVVSEKRLTSMLAAEKICNMCAHRADLKRLALKSKYYSYKYLLAAVSNDPQKKYRDLLPILKKEILTLRKQGFKPKTMKENIFEWMQLHFLPCMTDSLILLKRRFF